MRRITTSPWTLACLFLLLTFPAAGQGIPTTAPEDVGLSAERLARIRAVFQDDIDRGDLVGAVALVARRGRVAYFEPLGALDREAGTPMRRDAVFRIASMSKPVTSVAVMILFEEGHFLLDDPVSRFLPELEGLEVAVPGDGPLATEAATEAITIRHLLSHTSGLIYSAFYRGPLAQAYGEAGLWSSDLDHLVKQLGTLPLAHQPGTAWQYGVSTDVLARLVEVVSGRRFDRFLEERIFGPLGMTDTAFHVPLEKHERLAAHYRASEEGGLVPSPAFAPVKEPPLLQSGGGGLVSTVSDYARFLQMLANGGELDGARLLSRKSIELMTVDHVRDLPRSALLPESYGFGLGFAVLKELGGSGSPGSVGAYSWSGIYNTFFWVDPEEELFGIFMTQITPFGHQRFHQRFRALVYSAIAD